MPLSQYPGYRYGFGFYPISAGYLMYSDVMLRHSHTEHENEDTHTALQISICLFFGGNPVGGIQ